MTLTSDPVDASTSVTDPKLATKRSSPLSAKASGNSNRPVATGMTLTAAPVEALTSVTEPPVLRPPLFDTKRSSLLRTKASGWSNWYFGPDDLHERSRRGVHLGDLGAAVVSHEEVGPR